MVQTQSRIAFAVLNLKNSYLLRSYFHCRMLCHLSGCGIGIICLCWYFIIVQLFPVTALNPTKITAAKAIANIAVARSLPTFFNPGESALEAPRSTKKLKTTKRNAFFSKN